MGALTIVVYHYVRDVSRTRYRGLKALSVAGFEGQLDYITKYYSVCATRDVIAAVRGNGQLPPNACLLTFDDGFLDHFTVVFPRLMDRGLVASFYPPAVAVEERRVLDTHKIHFILAMAPDYGNVARQILDLMDRYRESWELPPGETLYLRYARPYMYDGPEAGFIKRVLQRELPEAVRSAIIECLFDEYVGDERTLAQELYMDLAQLRYLAGHGMEVGGHGAGHFWLGSLLRAQQEQEIARTLSFLARVCGSVPVDWVMCYPFGSYNEDTLMLLTRARCALGLTTRVGLAGDLKSPLELPRLDSTHLPTRGDAALSQWTVDALQGRATEQRGYGEGTSR
jgi:peptidoglycan/xylan/chitin deacetylase (PgdA/CDA1 family)